MTPQGKVIGTNQPGVTDHPSTSREPLMSRTLQTRLRDEPEATTKRILQILEELPEQPTVSPCLNPACDKQCRFPERGSDGYRPQMFCSRACRLTFDRVQRRLNDELQILENVATTRAMTRRQRVDLQREIGLRRWALARYPQEWRQP